MNRQRLALLIVLTLTFVGVSFVYFTDVWHDATTRFRTGLPVPKYILPEELLNPEDFAAKGPARPPSIRPTDPLLSGNASSTLTIIVYGDFQCEYCRDQSQAIEDALRLTGSTNDVRVVWRDYPLVNQHPRALAAATVATCAAQQGKFREMHDALFFRSKDLSDTEFLAFAKELDLDSEKFLVCLRDPAIPFRLMKDLEEARSLAITSVPLLFVDGEPISGYVDREMLAAIIRRRLTP